LRKTSDAMKRRANLFTPKPRITLRDLAKDLDLSVSTVSRAFHKDSAIAGETRRLVLMRAGELGYGPNPLARSLITKRTHIVGIVAADITNPFYPEVLNGLTEGLQTIDLSVMLVSASPSRSSDEALRLLLRYQPDIAILLAATLTSAAAQACQEAGTPVIFFNRYAADGVAWAVTCDNVQGGQQVADHLIERGHRRLAYVAGRPDASTTVDRWRGFRGRCVRRGLEAPVREEAGSFSYQAGYAAAQRLLARRPRPEAVFGANDIVALGVIDAARREFGLRVPEDLSVVGFDDIAMASWPPYALTTLRQPTAAMIEATVDIVRKLARHPSKTPRVLHIPGQLVERNTTARRGRTKAG
jgi:DNA-binding LacI/PurR family transcriptional regulator